MAPADAVSIVRELGIRESSQSRSLALLGPGDHAAPYPSGCAKIGHHKANRLAHFSPLCWVPDYVESCGSESRFHEANTRLCRHSIDSFSCPLQGRKEFTVKCIKAAPVERDHANTARSVSEI